MRLDKDGGIAIYIAAQKPEGLPEENWLPVTRPRPGLRNEPCSPRVKEKK